MKIQKLTAGSVVGSYHLDEQVGQGAFATVYRARDGRTGQVVAVKVLHATLASTPVPALRFVREAEALAMLSHPAIVRVLDFGEAPGNIMYLVMEWIDGHTLSEEARARGRFSAGELLGVLEPLCGALAAAHAAGFVHRDLKPSNVMVIPDGEWFQLKLVDFGIAKILDAEDSQSKLTTTGTAIGTPAYMAPELFAGDAVDARTDIYALGILCFRLLTGRLPFDSRNTLELAQMHLFADPPRVGAFVPALSRLDPVVARCLAKRPADRYRRVEDLLEDVRRAVGSGAARSAPPAPPPWIGVYLAVSAGPEEAWGDDVAERVFDCLDQAASDLTALGLSVAPAAGNALLAVGESGGQTDTLVRLVLSVTDLRARLAGALAVPGGTVTAAVQGADAAAELSDVRWALSGTTGEVLLTDRIQAACGLSSPAAGAPDRAGAGGDTAPPDDPERTAPVVRRAL